VLIQQASPICPQSLHIPPMQDKPLQQPDPHASPAVLQQSLVPAHVPPHLLSQVSPVQVFAAHEQSGLHLQAPSEQYWFDPRVQAIHEAHSSFIHALCPTPPTGVVQHAQSPSVHSAYSQLPPEQRPPEHAEQVSQYPPTQSCWPTNPAPVVQHRFDPEVQSVVTEYGTQELAAGISAQPSEYTPHPFAADLQVQMPVFR